MSVCNINPFHWYNAKANTYYADIITANKLHLNQKLFKRHKTIITDQ